MNNIGKQSPEWVKCLKMAFYYEPQDIEERIKVANTLYLHEPNADKKTRTDWFTCLEMALSEEPRDVEEQIKIASGIYKYGKELANNNKTILQKVLDKIKN